MENGEHKTDHFVEDETTYDSTSTTIYDNTDDLRQLLIVSAYAQQWNNLSQ